MKEEKTRKVVTQKAYIIKCKKDNVGDLKLFISFRSDNIPGLETSFSIYLKGSNADIIQLHNLLKAMSITDEIDIKFIKSCTCKD